MNSLLRNLLKTVNIYYYILVFSECGINYSLEKDGNLWNVMEHYEDSPSRQKRDFTTSDIIRLLGNYTVTKIVSNAEGTKPELRLFVEIN